MLFPSVEFLVFFAALLTGLSLLARYADRKILLLVASYVFYMWWNPAFIVLIIFSTIVDYVLGRRLERAENPALRRGLLIASMCANLGVLGFFKYANFFQQNLLGMWTFFGEAPGWSLLEITLPVGISFYTFQTMSYTIDVYRRKIPACESPLDFALFVSFFPQLVAGPIVRAADFLPQLQVPNKIRVRPEDALLILRGLMKKVLIADNLAPFVDRVFQAPETWPSAIIWAAAIAFSIQIYCDFSGYSDMAIGLARMIGFDLPLNFNWPYFAMNPSSFWRRWHISLSTWLRDYLYIPLGGSRHGKWKTYRNLMLTMLLGGLWHGASWNFVLWGGLHGIALATHRIYSQYAERNDWLAHLQSRWFYQTLSWGMMQVFVLMTWITFRVSDTSKMLVALKKFVIFDFNFSLAGIGIGALSFFSAIVILATFLVLHLISWKVGGLDRRLATAPSPVLAMACALAGVALVLFWPTTEAPFIYFQF